MVEGVSQLGPAVGIGGDSVDQRVWVSAIRSWACARERLSRVSAKLGDTSDI